MFRFRVFRFRAPEVRKSMLIVEGIEPGERVGWSDGGI
jgi:hypothetical protein